MQFEPTAPLENIRRRADVMKKIRRYFDEKGFVEVQTPILSHDTVLDHYLDPLSLDVNVFGKTETFYLQTSPEFLLKRLLASGMDRIFEITPVFRRGDRGRFHNIEFTMLEWYRTGDSYQNGIDLLADLIVALGPFEDCERKSFAETVLKKTGINPNFARPEEYLRYAQSNGIEFAESFLDPDNPASTDDWLDLIFSEKIQPELGHDLPVILYDYPGSQAQLAQTRTVTDKGHIVEVAERFELFINGLELANGYHELCDPDVLRARNKKTELQRRRSGSDELPIESKLLQAMEFGLPDSCGCALGIERLLMILFGAESIDQVLPFPIERA